MARRDTFTLKLPTAKPVEVQLIQLEDGSIVARTASELQRADKPTEAPSRG